MYQVRLVEIVDFRLAAHCLQKHRERTVLVGRYGLNRVHDDADAQRLGGHLVYWFLLFPKGANYTGDTAQARFF
jgi:hypothetical protein